MKIAAFSDIHSNHFALEAALDRATQCHIDAAVFLGDYVSDCACPQKTLALLRQAASRWPAWFIRGNREEYLLAHQANPDDGWHYGSAMGSLLYTYEALTDADLDWFAGLPIAMTIRPDEGAPFEICHGGLSATRGNLRPDTPEMHAAFAAMNTDLLLCGHTHRAFVTRQCGKTLVNGGTVGFTNAGVPRAEFALIEWDGEDWAPTLVRTKYDVDAAIREMRDSGFMEKAGVWARCAAATLRDGHAYTIDCIELVGRLAAETGLSGRDEPLWLRAADQLGI